MSKSNNPTYIAERLARTKIRKATRKNKRWDNLRIYGRGDSRCHECGNAMTWCSTCDMWSRHCCVDYGTCQCN